jgi:hypothetical protein
VTTVCAKCQHLYIVNKNDAWYRWLCMKAPLPKLFNYVTGETVADPPYSFCRRINEGDCQDFEEGVNALHPADKEGE